MPIEAEDDEGFWEQGVGELKFPHVGKLGICHAFPSQRMKERLDPWMKGLGQG